MTEGLHPLAAAHQPPFITAAGETDVLLVIMGLFLVGIVVAVGLLYLNLHAIPEHVSHRANKIQFEIVAVLSLLPLFTHNNIYWVAALLLAMVTIPDFFGPFNSIDASLRTLARREDRRTEAGDASSGQTQYDSDEES
jgi:hypothetical protein